MDHSVQPLIKLFFISGECSLSQFQCNDGECVSNSFVCDTNRDCADSSDEFGCGNEHTDNILLGLLILMHGIVYITDCPITNMQMVIILLWWQ